MTIKDLATEYGVTTNQIEEVVSSTITREYLDDNTKADGQLSKALVGAIKQVLRRNGMEPIASKDKTENPIVESDPQDNTQSLTEDSSVIEQNETATEEFTSDVLPEKKPKKPSKNAVKQTIEKTDIMNVPPSVLRKFYAENFTVKLDKIFFMDDESVKAKVDEKFVVLEREQDYIFLRRNTAIISVKKEG